jgi:probable rRNA maturation factor
MSRVTITNRARVERVDGRRLKPIVRLILSEAGFVGNLSLVLLDDPEMHDLNLRFLEHDYPTDVLAFPFDEAMDGLGGEVIVSGETALREAQARERPFMSELLLYISHGILHLTGMEDHTRAGRLRMDRAAARILKQLGHQ